ncbi:MAG: hypothetical protein J5643_07250 [Lachnospiraceae bacterium]|nr:hypothetical protein [Lachnospiraceae bacterium]
MMQITVCDRCGKTFSPMDKSEVIFWITVEEIVTESDNALKARRILDLCYSCRKSLSDWYKDGSQYKIRGLENDESE